MQKKLILILCVMLVFVSCGNKENIMQFKNMFLSDYYYVDENTKTFFCYGPYSNAIECYSLTEKKKVWAFSPEEMGDSYRSLSFEHSSFNSGKVLLSLKDPAKNDSLANLCVVDIYSGKIEKKLNLSGTVFYTLKNNNNLYAVVESAIPYGKEKIKRNVGAFKDISIIKIDLVTFKSTVIFKLSTCGQDLTYLKSNGYISELFIQVPLIIDGDSILFYTDYNSSDNNDKKCLYSINKNNGNVNWIQKSITRELLVLNAFVVAGVVIAWPNAFVLEPRNLTLLGVLIVMYMRSIKQNVIKI